MASITELVKVVMMTQAGIGDMLPVRDLQQLLFDPALADLKKKRLQLAEQIKLATSGAPPPQPRVEY